MYTLFLVAAFVAVTPDVAPFPQEHISCTRDTECPKNYFCYLDTSLCAMCNPEFCLRRNRHNSKYRLCHKDFKECGSCLPGFEEEILTDGTNREACIVSFSSPPMELSADSEEPGLSNHLVPFALGVVMCFFIALPGLAYIGWKVKNSRRNSIVDGSCQEMETLCEQTSLQNVNNSSPRVNEQPPQYPDEQPPQYPDRRPPQYADELTPPYLDDQLPPYHHEQLDYKLRPCAPPPELCEKVVARFVQAIPFRSPDYEENEFSNSPTIDLRENDIEEPDSSIYHDESTQPSSWTPQTTSGNSESSSDVRPPLKRTLAEEGAMTKKKKVEPHCEANETVEENPPESSDRPFKQFSKSKKEES